MIFIIAYHCALEAVNMFHMQPKVPYKVNALVAQIATMGEIMNMRGFLTRKVN